MVGFSFFSMLWLAVHFVSQLWLAVSLSLALGYDSLFLSLSAMICCSFVSPLWLAVPLSLCAEMACFFVSWLWMVLGLYSGKQSYFLESLSDIWFAFRSGPSPPSPPSPLLPSTLAPPAPLPLPPLAHSLPTPPPCKVIPSSECRDDPLIFCLVIFISPTVQYCMGLRLCWCSVL